MSAGYHCPRCGEPPQYPGGCACDRAKRGDQEKRTRLAKVCLEAWEIDAVVRARAVDPEKVDCLWPAIRSRLLELAEANEQRLNDYQACSHDFFEMRRERDDAIRQIGEEARQRGSLEAVVERLREELRGMEVPDIQLRNAWREGREQQMEDDSNGD